MADLIERTYDQHADALFAYLMNLTRAEADAQDAMQEVFRRLIEKPALLDDVRDPRAYLLRLAHNAAVDAMRRRSTRDKYHAGFGQEEEVRLFKDSPDPDEAVFREALAAALGTLPAEQRAVVHLKLWEGATFERIAEMLEIPANTAASRYRYAMDKLRGHLRPLYEEMKEPWTTSNNF